MPVPFKAVPSACGKWVALRLKYKVSGNAMKDLETQIGNPRALYGDHEWAYFQ